MSDFNKRTRLYKPPFVIIACLISLVIGLAGGYLLFHRSTSVAVVGSKRVIDEVADLIENNWVDTTESADTIESRMIAGSVDGLGDPHSSYMSASEIADFNKSIDGKYEGIGVTYLPVVTGALVTRVYDGTPADQAQLKTGDIITGVDGQSLKGKDSTGIKNLIVGEPKTSLTLTIDRDGQEITKKLTRAELNIDAYYHIAQSEKHPYGYLEIITFGDQTASKVEAALYTFAAANIDTIVIDLRDNGGGYLVSVKSILSLFTEKGTSLFSLESKTGHKAEYKSEGNETFHFQNGYILINENTASASEVMALALRDLQGYQLVGTNSYGKGTAQTQATLSDSSVLKYTYAKWYGPKGTNVNGTGLTPDVEVKEESYASYSFKTVTKTYKEDQVDAKIRTMQMMLKTIGYKIDRTDGYFSAKTAACLKSFQQDEKLDVSGIYDQKTYLRLYASFIKAIRTEKHDAVLNKVKTLIK